MKGLGWTGASLACCNRLLLWHSNDSLCACVPYSAHDLMLFLIDFVQLPGTMFEKCHCSNAWCGAEEVWGQCNKCPACHGMGSQAVYVRRVFCGCSTCCQRLFSLTWTFKGPVLPCLTGQQSVCVAHCCVLSGTALAAASSPSKLSILTSKMHALPS